jgi:chromosomal replication initiator protein
MATPIIDPGLLALVDFDRSPRSRTGVASILATVAEAYGLTSLEIRRRTHRRSIARPRQVAMFVLRQTTYMSLPEIGKAFGGLHHTTVLHGIRQVERRISGSEEARQALCKLVDQCQQSRR